MALALTGTNYVTDTDALLSVADEKLIIEAADDRKIPNTTAKSFVDLQANAVAGGAGSDPEKVRDQVLATISAVVKDAEAEINGYAQAFYIIPLNPVDPYIKSLTADWSWYNLLRRRSMYRTESDRIAAEKQLISRAMRILDQSVPLTAVVLPQGSGADEMIYDFGYADRVAYREPLPPVYGLRKI